MSNVCCKEDFEASKNIMVSLNYTFCFRIHVEKDGSNAAMDTLHFHVVYVTFSCVLRNKIKYLMFSSCLKETVAIMFIPGGTLLQDVTSKFVNVINVILYIAVT